jgi:hypothetical protein
MANTIPLKTVFAREYQRTHFRKACYPLFADLRFEKELQEGGSVKFSYDDDAVAGDLTGADGYTLKARTVTDETLTVNQKPMYGFVIKASERIQDHRPTQEKWARKSMNVIFQKVDGDILNDLRSNAATVLDAASFGGSAGAGIVVSSSNAAAIFAAAQRALTNQNVIYDENKHFKNVIVLDGGERFPVAAIPAELKEALLLQVGFKNTGEGDQVMKSGFMGMMFGFNAIASTSLPFSFRYTLTATPTNDKKLVLGGAIGATTTIGTAGAAVKITWVTTIGTTPGNVLAEVDATTSVTNLVNLLNDPYNGVANKSVAFVKANLSVSQQRILDNVSAVDNADGSCVITLRGYGTRQVAQDDANGTLDRRKIHAIFGVSRSIAVIMQREPGIAQSSGEIYTTGELTGFLGKHFVAWGLYGRKVFETHKPQIIDVQIDAANYGYPASALK